MNFFRTSPIASPVVLITVIFGSALLWAKTTDPFVRTWFKTNNNGESVSGVIITAKPVSARPVVIYLDEVRTGKTEVGLRLRQLAELGLTAVSFAYNPTNQNVFDQQLGNVLAFVSKLEWSQTNPIVWFGRGGGAQRLLEALPSFSTNPPQLVVSLEGGLPSSFQPTQSKTKYLLIHGQENAVFSAQAVASLATNLQQPGVNADLSLLAGIGYQSGRDNDTVYRGIAEYIAASLEITAFPTRTRWAILSWLPALLLLLWWLGQQGATVFTWCFSNQPRISRRVKVYYCLAAGFAACALLQSAVHIGLPSLNASASVTGATQKMVVRPEHRSDFSYLAAALDWTDKPARQLIEHVELANLQRTFFYPDLDEESFRQYVLLPKVGEVGRFEWGWRRHLWEAFYPRVRKQNDPMEAAGIVVRFLRERVTVDTKWSRASGVETAWESGRTDDLGFDEIYVAALRSVGIAARLGLGGSVELWTGSLWSPAPQPLIRAGFPFTNLTDESQAVEGKRAD